MPRRAPERLAEALPPGWTGRAAVSARQAPERRDPETCRADFAAAVTGADLRFPAGSPVLAPSFYPMLDALATVAKACPTLRITVSGTADPAKPKAPTPPPGEEPRADAVEPARVASAAKPDWPPSRRPRMRPRPPPSRPKVRPGKRRPSPASRLRRSPPRPPTSHRRICRGCGRRPWSSICCRPERGPSR